jgi:sigma-E factor negative regulatory protein RseB
MKSGAATTTLVAVLLGLSLAAVASSSDDAGHWVERMSAAMSQMSYQGTFVYVQGDQVESMRITHVSDEKGVRERLVSVSGAQREILRDSNGVRWVQGDDHSVMEDPSFGRSFFPEIPLKTSDEAGVSYQFELGEKSRIAGHSGRKVRIIPRDQYRYGYNLWLEEQSALLLKWELLDSNQKRLAKLMFTDLRLGSEVDLQELKSTSQLQEFKTLESSLPPGSSLSHSKPKWQAGKLPPGFRLTAHRYLGKKSQEVYEHMVYSDGLAAVSVYVEGNSDGLQAKDTGISRMGTTHAFSRVADDVLITVVGDVPAATVRAIGESVKYRSP